MQEIRQVSNFSLPNATTIYHRSKQSLRAFIMNFASSVFSSKFYLKFSCQFKKYLQAGDLPKRPQQSADGQPTNNDNCVHKMAMWGIFVAPSLVYLTISHPGINQGSSRYISTCFDIKDAVTCHCPSHCMWISRTKW